MFLHGMRRTAVQAVQVRIANISTKWTAVSAHLIRLFGQVEIIGYTFKLTEKYVTFSKFKKFKLNYQFLFTIKNLENVEELGVNLIVGLIVGLKERPGPGTLKSLQDCNSAVESTQFRRWIAYSSEWAVNHCYIWQNYNPSFLNDNIFNWYRN